MDASLAEIQWKIEYPPRSVIPTAPRAMIDACAKNGFFGFGRPPRMPAAAYATHPSSVDSGIYPGANANNSSETHSSDFEDRVHSSYSSPHKSSDYKSSKLSESLNSNIPYDSPHHTDSPIAATPTGPAAATAAQPKLPNNWKTAYAEDGTIYYYHRITGKTQWNFPEEKVSSIEGVNQSDLEDLVEKTIQDAEKKKLESARSASPAVSIISRNGAIKASPRVITPSVSRRGSDDTGVASNSLNENELKKEVGKIVTKYLSSKQKSLWKGDKYLFKELARKVKYFSIVIFYQVNTNLNLA